jgi:tetratricopeptide (TPR) repeat protein
MNGRFLTIAFGIFVLGACTTSFAQQKKASSEGKRYQSYKVKESNNVPDLLADAKAIMENDPKTALDKVEEALGISLAQGNTDDEIRCYILLGEINESIQEWKLALEYFTSAYEKLEPSGKIKKRLNADQGSAMRGMASANLHLGNYETALHQFQQALSMAASSIEQAERRIDISETYYQMQDYQNAIAALDEINISKDGNNTLESKIQNQKAKIYAQTNQVQKAVDAYQSSQNSMRGNNTSRQKNEEQSLKIAKEEVADVLHEQQLYDDEINFRNSSLEFNLESNKLKDVTEDKIGLGKALAAKGDNEAAIREFEDAIRLADTLNTPKEKAQAFLALANIYEGDDRPRQALSAYKKYSEAVTQHESQIQHQLAERAELLKKQRDIEELTKDVAIGKNEETIVQKTVFNQRLIIYGLIAIIVIVLITSYFIYKNALASKTANQLLALKSLRSQMNPHFIFNALNSVNHFIAQNDERTANKFLSEFSRLMRLVLENSQEDFIPLTKEQEIISLYIKLEHYRFRDKFDYEINIEEDINLEAVEIPPMLVQPYIENAVWHGLRYKESKGHLSLSIGKNHQGLKIEITDDGIGRKRSTSLKTENQKKQHSTGLKNIQERLNIINKVYKVHYVIEVSDLSQNDPQHAGTRVIIHLPFRKQTEQV